MAALLLTRPNEHGWMRPTWTRELLCLQMNQTGWPRVAVCTMGRALQQAGVRLGSPKLVVRCPCRARGANRFAVTARVGGAREQERALLYCDEVDVRLNPKIGRDWMLRGH